MSETWTLLPCLPKVAVREAIRAESEGFSGVMLADSQNLAAELVVEMTLCLAATKRILVSPGVTNPVTRHPAVLAGAMATLQAESGGRAVIEIGRGDSALAHLGFSPMKLGPFKAYLSALQGYLSGHEVPFDARFVPEHISSVSAMGLGEVPDSSSLRWLREGSKKVPVGVAATGPKVIGIAAVCADGVTLSVGADPDRVRGSADIARDARRAAGMDPDDLRLAAFVNVAVHDDIDIAARMTAGKLASFSRFSVMHGKVVAGVDTADKESLEQLHRSYSMNTHGNADAEHTQSLSVDFADRNAVIGSAEKCLERLWALKEAGISRFIFTEDFSRTGDAGQAHENLVKFVLPEVNSWT